MPSGVLYFPRLFLRWWGPIESLCSFCRPYICLLKSFVQWISPDCFFKRGHILLRSSQGFEQFFSGYRFLSGLDGIAISYVLSSNILALKNWILQRATLFRSDPPPFYCFKMLLSLLFITVGNVSSSSLVPFRPFHIFFVVNSLLCFLEEFSYSQIIFSCFGIQCQLLSHPYQFCGIFFFMRFSIFYISLHSSFEKIFESELCWYNIFWLHTIYTYFEWDKSFNLVKTAEKKTLIKIKILKKFSTPWLSSWLPHPTPGFLSRSFASAHVADSSKRRPFRPSWMSPEISFSLFYAFNSDSNKRPNSNKRPPLKDK